MAQRFTRCTGKLSFMLQWLICQPVPTTCYDSVVRTWRMWEILGFDG